jgi:hypothetical protein
VSVKRAYSLFEASDTATSCFVLFSGHVCMESQASERNSEEIQSMLEPLRAARLKSLARKMTASFMKQSSDVSELVAVQFHPIQILGIEALQSPGCLRRVWYSTPYWACCGFVRTVWCVPGASGCAGGQFPHGNPGTTV